MSETCEHKELTSGTIGGLNSYISTFNISCSDKELIIKTPFKEVIIPFEYIDKITLKTRVGMQWFVGGCWSIEHHYPKAPKNIGFIPLNKETWLSIFDNKKIQVEDAAKNIDSTKWKKAHRTNLFIGILCALIGLIALVSVVINVIIRVLK
jgi:hypothetical protein